MTGGKSIFYVTSSCLVSGFCKEDAKKSRDILVISNTVSCVYQSNISAHHNDHIIEKYTLTFVSVSILKKSKYAMSLLQKVFKQYLQAIQLHAYAVLQKCVHRNYYIALV